MLLANLVYETSTGVLQTHKRFDWLALINTIQSIITTVLILLAFFLSRSVIASPGSLPDWESLCGDHHHYPGVQADEPDGRSWVVAHIPETGEGMARHLEICG